MSSDRLAVFSRRMATASLWFIVAMLLLNAACWLYPSLATIDGGHGLSFSLTDRLLHGIPVDIGAAPWWQRVGAIVLSSVPLLALAASLWHLHALFRCYARRDYFSVATATHLGKVGRYVALWVLLSLLCEPLLSTWLTMMEPPGHRVATLSFGSPYVVALFLAACVEIIAQTLRRAGGLRAEPEPFI